MWDGRGRIPKLGSKRKTLPHSLPTHEAVAPLNECTVPYHSSAEGTVYGALQPPRSAASTLLTKQRAASPAPADSDAKP